MSVYMQNIIKFLIVMDMLSQRNGTTAEKIAERLNISRTNIYRWLKPIEALGYYIDKDQRTAENHIILRLDQNYNNNRGIDLPVGNFEPAEIIALYFLKGQAKTLHGTKIEPFIDSAFQKIELGISPQFVKKLNKLQSTFLCNDYMSKNYAGKEEFISLLTNAILDNQSCYISYHSFSDDTDKNFKIDPLHFFEYNGGLYFFVNASSFNNILTLAVDRINSVELSGESFTYPEDFNPEERLKYSFGIINDGMMDIEIWFAEDQVRYIKERQWAAEQEIIDQDDGSIILKMHTSGRYDIKRWIMGYGADAEVLKPDDFREEIKEALRLQYQRYFN